MTADDRRRRARIWAWALACSVTVGLCGPAPAWAGKLTCLTGTDPVVANDAPQIAVARQNIETLSCEPCTSFDGSPGKTHGDYLKCVKLVVNAFTALSGLRKQCGSTVVQYYANSTCGLSPTKNAAPCLKTSASGKVSCAIKPVAKCKTVACSGLTAWVDAADTNFDGLIGKGDSGACVPNLLSNPSFETGELGAPTPWQSGAYLDIPDTFAWDNTVAHDGALSVKLASPTTANDARWTQTVSVQPYTRYRFSGWVKTENVGHTPQSVDAGANLCLLGGFTYGSGVFGTNDWRPISLTFDSGVADHVVLCARLGFFSGVTTGTAWFDDLRLVQLSGSAAPPTPTFTSTRTVTPTPTRTNTLPPGAPTYTPTVFVPSHTPTGGTMPPATNTPTPDPVGCCALPNTGICVDSFGGIGPAYCAANNGTWMPQQHCGCGENCLGSCGPPPPSPTLTPTPIPTPGPRFHDNGDGTITDLQTGLMWEKKDRAGGLHDVYTDYPWAGLCGCTTYTDGSAGQCTGSEPLCQPDASAASVCSGQTGGALGCAQCSAGSCNVRPFGANASTTIWGGWRSSTRRTSPATATGASRRWRATAARRSWRRSCRPPTRTARPARACRRRSTRAARLGAR